MSVVRRASAPTAESDQRRRAGRRTAGSSPRSNASCAATDVERRRAPSATRAPRNGREAQARRAGRAAPSRTIRTSVEPAGDALQREAAQRGRDRVRLDLGARHQAAAGRGRVDVLQRRRRRRRRRRPCPRKAPGRELARAARFENEYVGTVPAGRGSRSRRRRPPTRRDRRALPVARLGGGDGEATRGPASA